MKALVVCQICGKKIFEVNKPSVSDQDIKEYEQVAKCEVHGGNEYSYDEDGLITSQTSFVVKAIRQVE